MSPYTACFTNGNKEMIISPAKVHIIFVTSKRFSEKRAVGQEKNKIYLDILKKSVTFAPDFRGKVGRVNDRAGLEIRYTLLGIGGLNPSPSANKVKIKEKRMLSKGILFVLGLC